MIQQPAPSTRITGTVRRGGAPPDRPLPDPAQAWKGGRTLIRLVDITVRKQGAAAQQAAPAASQAAPSSPAAPAVPAPHPAAVAKQDTLAAIVAEAKPPATIRPTPPAMSARKAVPIDASWQPLIVLGLISLLFAVLAAAIVTGRSNVDPPPDLAPAPAWRATPGNEAQQNETQQAGPTGGRERPVPDEPAREAVEIELPDPALSEAAPTFEERTPPSIPRIPPVASFRGHIEPDTMEARHDQPGSSIH